MACRDPLPELRLLWGRNPQLFLLWKSADAQSCPKSGCSPLWSWLLVLELTPKYVLLSSLGQTD